MVSIHPITPHLSQPASRQRQVQTLDLSLGQDTVRFSGKPYKSNLNKATAQESPKPEQSAQKSSTTEQVKPEPKAETTGKTKAQGTQKPQEPDEQQGFIKNMLLGGASLFLLPAIPMTWMVGAVAALTLGLPLFSAVVKPRISPEGELLNPKEVIGSLRSGTRKVHRILTFPLKFLPNVGRWKKTVIRIMVKSTRYVRFKAMEMLHNPKINSFITKVPSSTFKKFFYFARWGVMLLSVLLEKKLLARIPILGKLISGVMGLGVFASSEMRQTALSIFNSLLPDAMKKGSNQ